MTPAGIFLAIIGYTLIWCGFNDVPIAQELRAGLGGPDPLLAKAAGEAVATTGSGSGKQSVGDQVLELTPSWTDNIPGIGPILKLWQGLNN